MDRNCTIVTVGLLMYKSLSARRAWIEISTVIVIFFKRKVALRKESVDRNSIGLANSRAYIVALRKESVDRNTSIDNITQGVFSRSPQGERG